MKALFTFCGYSFLTVVRQRSIIVNFEKNVTDANTNNLEYDDARLDVPWCLSIC